MMRREIVEKYKDRIDTPEQMLVVLTTIRDHLLKQYCIYYGWGLEETCSLMELVLKLNAEIRYYENLSGKRHHCCSTY